MRKMIDLSLTEQASIVLLCLLEDVATEKRTMAGIDYHVSRLWEILAEQYDLVDDEVNLVVEAVAKRGVEMLPAFQVGEQNENPAGEEQGQGTEKVAEKPYVGQTDHD